MADAPQPRQLVLVDDEPTSYATLHEILEQADLEFESGSTFEEANLVMSDPKQHYLVLLNAHTDPSASMLFMRQLGNNAELRARCLVVDISHAVGNTDVLPAREADRVIERPLNQQELLTLIRGSLNVAAP